MVAGLPGATPMRDLSIEPEESISESLNVLTDLGTCKRLINFARNIAIPFLVLESNFKIRLARLLKKLS